MRMSHTPLDVPSHVVVGQGLPFVRPVVGRGVRPGALRSTAVILLALALTGCSMLAERLGPEWPAQQSYEETLAAKYASGIPTEAYLSAAERNETVDELIYLCNVVFREYEVGLYTDGAALEVVGDVVTVGASAAGAISGGLAAQVLSGVIAASTGAKTSLQTNFYQEQSRLALLTKAAAQRSAKLEQIEDLQMQDIDAWPMSAAMLEVQAYYDSGTLLSALKAIAEQAGSDLKASRERLGAARGRRIGR